MARWLGCIAGQRLFEQLARERPQRLAGNALGALVKSSLKLLGRAMYKADTHQPFQLCFHALKEPNIPADAP